MAGLQRSVVSFRRQGSSGLVWDDKFVSEELNKAEQREGESGEAAARDIPPIKTIDRSRSNSGGGGRGFRSKDTAVPSMEPQSPRVSACGLCGAFGKSAGKKQRATAAGKRRSR